jgi:hypothetical protein
MAPVPFCKGKSCFIFILADAGWFAIQVQYFRGTNMQKLPATLMAALFTIVVLRAAYSSDSDDSPYVTRQNHAAPVTITESLDNPSKQFTGEVRHSSDIAPEATSIEDQRQRSETHAERRQRMIEHCERNYGINCAREIDIELSAKAIRRDHVVHLMRRADGR